MSDATIIDPLAHLPHQPPFRFITRMTAMVPQISGEATWSVTGDEWFLTGHFPGQPIVPGVLIVEALAQLSGVVSLLPPDGSAPAGGRLAHADVRFAHAVIPPAEIELFAEHSRSIGALHQLDGRAEVGGIVAARGTLVVARAEGMS